jgi:hypothetical protein
MDYHPLIVEPCQSTELVQPTQPAHGGRKAYRKNSGTAGLEEAIPDHSTNPVSSRNAECLTSGMPIAYRSRFAGGEDVLDDRDR